MEQLQVQEYSLIDFAKKVQELVQKGYEFDFEDNSKCPINYGYNYFAIMTKVEKEAPIKKKKEAA